MVEEVPLQPDLGSNRSLNLADSARSPGLIHLKIEAEGKLDSGAIYSCLWLAKLLVVSGKHDRFKASYPVALPSPWADEKR